MVEELCKIRSRSLTRSKLSRFSDGADTSVVGDQRKRQLSAHPLVPAFVAEPRYTCQYCQCELVASVLRCSTARRVLHVKVYSRCPGYVRRC
jgi:hypothetical protein